MSRMSGMPTPAHSLHAILKVPLHSQHGPWSMKSQRGSTSPLWTRTSCSLSNMVSASPSGLRPVPWQDRQSTIPSPPQQEQCDRGGRMGPRPAAALLLRIKNSSWLEQSNDASSSDTHSGSVVCTISSCSVLSDWSLDRSNALLLLLSFLVGRPTLWTFPTRCCLIEEPCTLQVTVVEIII